MRRSHDLPFGAQLTDAGTRFGLWAPGAQGVSLCLEGRPEIPMDGDAQGWFRTTVEDAGAGSRYHFRVNNALLVPDPASRFQPEDVHAASEVIDPAAYDWKDGDWQNGGWRSRPWHEVVLYELHVGSFSPSGDYAGVESRLEDLRELGVTAVELMPLADFPGRRNWGYDGVLPYAPDAAYGRPEDLKRLVDRAHALGLMVFVDVVYNHFGPDGNYLGAYAPQFFTERHQTPWGAAINYDGATSRVVRDFFIHNALYWLTEYHMDGLRLDAVHAIRDDSEPNILAELAATVRARLPDRHVHLVLENDANQARFLRPRLESGFDAQWNDDAHHAFHVLLTGESGGYYADYADDPAACLGRCLAEGFAYQGDASNYRDGEVRGESSADLPATAFVNFLQNHDQIGNRAFGERLGRIAPPEALRAGAAVYLLAPSVPMLFMGEEWGASAPFPFFCDFSGELARLVTEGRRREFAKFPEFSDPAARDRIPDPEADATFASARLDWDERNRDDHAAILVLYRELLGVRARELTPRLAGLSGGDADFEARGRALRVEWRLRNGARLLLLANLNTQSADTDWTPAGRPLWASHPWQAGHLAAWQVGWWLEG